MGKVFDFIKSPYMFFKTAKQELPEFAALKNRLDDVLKIENVADRVVAAEELRADASKLGMNRELDVHPIAFMPTFAPVGLLGGAIVALATATPIGFAILPGFAVGLGISFLGSLAGLALRDVNVKIAINVRDSTASLIKNAPQSENFLSIAESPHFKKLMDKYPGMKESFLLAATQEKVAGDLRQAKPAQPKADGGGGLRL